MSRTSGRPTIKWSLSLRYLSDPTALPPPLPSPSPLRLQTLELVIQPTHEFLVLASDGLWEKCSCVEVVNFIRRRLFEHGDVMRAAKEMVAKVESQGSS
jgi:serine/threonine protein phosphatase PrpC